MFIERPDDAQQAKLYALGLIKEKDAFRPESRLVLVPCKNPKWCKTHGTTRTKLRLLKKRIKRKIQIGNKS